MRIGLDFGLTTTDAVALAGAASTLDLATPGAFACATLDRPGPADPAVLARAVAALEDALRGAGGPDEPAGLRRLAVTGGRSRNLPEVWREAPVVKVAEPEAIGRGGLALADVRRALIVSCGTGTAMVAADRDLGRYRHVTGTAVGGGTLVGLAHTLLGVRDPDEIAALAERGRAAGVDTTLGEVLGGGIGTLPPEATAVNLGRLADLAGPADPADLAAGLVAMVAQVIALLALNAAQAHALPAIVVTGRLAGLAPVAATFDAVADLYARPRFVRPAQGDRATAIGAVLAADISA